MGEDYRVGKFTTGVGVNKSEVPSSRHRPPIEGEELKATPFTHRKLPNFTCLASVGLCKGHERYDGTPLALSGLLPRNASVVELDKDSEMCYNGDA